MKSKFLISLSTISTFILVGWIITGFFGSMILYLVVLWWILIPFILIFLTTFLITIYKTVKQGYKTNHVLIGIHGFALLSIFSLCVYESELLKSRAIVDATLIDDMSSINIKLRVNGRFQTTSTGMFFYQERRTGNYIFRGDTIVFLDRPYSNNFIPNRILVSKKDSTIYISKDKDGNFSREKTFANFFRINKIK